jgi:multidrug resistance efflux pump
MVEKGALLATLDMTEFNESVTQAQDRVTLSQKRLASAREKTSETEIRKLESELQSMEAKRAFSQQDLAKLVKTAPVKTEAKRSELAQKKSDLTSKEASYALDRKILEADIQNKATMIDKKLAESKKITESILQTAPADFSDLQTVRNGINKIFSFDITKVTDDDRSKAYYHGWNVT